MGKPKKPSGFEKASRIMSYIALIATTGVILMILLILIILENTGVLAELRGLMNP